MPELSVVIITFNEERNIGRCLESVKDIADEIVVVDSHSTDNTKLICETYGVKFIEHDFEGYIRQKQYAISQAAFPHQLSLDADEALSGELKTEIKRIKENWQCDGYRMNRLANYCGKWIRHSGWYPDTKLRLYDSTKGKWQGVDPHDKYMMVPGSSEGFLKGDILHYTFNTIEEHLRQVEKFSTISAREHVAIGKPVCFFMIITNPFIKFIRNYLLHFGFLDGYYGFFICLIAARYTFLKYRKALQLKRLKRKGSLTVTSDIISREENCRICNEEKGKQIGIVDYWDIKTSRLVQCVSCGHIQLDPMLNDEETSKGCQAYYIEEGLRTSKEEQFKNCERNFRRGVVFGFKLKRKKITPRSILELGPGTGYFSAGLKFAFPPVQITVMDIIQNQ